VVDANPPTIERASTTATRFFILEAHGGRCPEGPIRSPPGHISRRSCVHTPGFDAGQPPGFLIAFSPAAKECSAGRLTGCPEGLQALRDFAGP